MHRVIVIAAAGLSLAGCASFSLDSFRSAPPPVTVEFDSVPSGAEARTSSGQNCKTPCSVAVAAADSFSVTFTLAKYQPVTVPVQVIRQPGDITTPATTIIDPNPVVAELPLIAPAKRATRTRAIQRKRTAPKAAAAGSPFPAPAAAPTAR